MAPHLDRRQLLRATSLGAAGILTDKPLSELTGTLVSDVGSDEWPMFHHNAAATGHAPSKNGPSSSRISEQWSVGISQASTPVFADDNVYISKNGTAYAFDQQTGDGIWRTEYTETTDDADWDGFYRNDYVAVGNGMVYTASFDKGVFGLNTSSGDLEWSFEHPHVGHLRLYSGSIYVGGGDGNIKKINSTNGELEKSYDQVSEDYGGDIFISSPCIAEEKLFALTHDPYLIDIKLHSLDMSSGEYLWEAKLQNGHRAVIVPAYLDGNIYLFDGTEVHEFDTNTGTSSWTTEIVTSQDWEVSCSPSVTEDFVFVNCNKGQKIVAIDRDSGREVWSKQFGERDDGFQGTCSSPIVADNAVYVGLHNGPFYAFESESGEKIWEFDTPSDVAASVSNGTVFVSGDSLYALTDEPNEPPTAAIDYNPENPLIDETVEFTASNSSDDQTIDQYRWDFDNDKEFEATGVNQSYVFSEPGTHTVTLKIIDDQGAQDTTQATVDVARPNQVPTAKFSYSPSNPIIDETVTFDATASSDPDGSIRSYGWFIGNRQTTGQTIEHEFSQPGEQSVVLEVTDTDGLTATSKQTVTVRQRRVSLQLTADETTVSVDDGAIVILSVVNYLTSEPVTIQLLLQTPSGVSVAGVANADEGSNQYTAVATVDPASETNIRIRLNINDARDFVVQGEAIYYFGESDSNSYRYQDSVTFDITGSDQTSSETPRTNKSDDETSTTGVLGPGFGVISALAGGGLGIAELIRRKQGSDDDQSKDHTD